MFIIYVSVWTPGIIFVKKCLDIDICDVQTHNSPDYEKKKKNTDETCSVLFRMNEWKNL